MLATSAVHLPIIKSAILSETYLFTARIEKVQKLYNITMLQFAHNLQFAIL